MNGVELQKLGENRRNCFTRAAIVAEIRKVIEEHAEGIEKLEDTTELVADLGIDSLGVMEVVADIEDRFEITISDSELREVATFADVVGAIENRLRELGRLGVEQAEQPAATVDAGAEAGSLSADSPATEDE